MQTSATLSYDYTTKNFHRFSRAVPVGAVNEVYIPKAHMAQLRKVADDILKGVKHA